MDGATIKDSSRNRVLGVDIVANGGKLRAVISQLWILSKSKGDKEVAQQGQRHMVRHDEEETEKNTEKETMRALHHIAGRWPLIYSNLIYMLSRMVDFVRAAATTVAHSAVDTYVHASNAERMYPQTSSIQRHADSSERHYALTSPSPWIDGITYISDALAERCIMDLSRFEASVNPVELQQRRRLATCSYGVTGMDATKAKLKIVLRWKRKGAT